MSRPFRNRSAEDLENEFALAREKADQQRCREVHQELVHRTTRRARRLRAAIEEYLGGGHVAENTVSSFSEASRDLGLPVGTFPGAPAPVGEGEGEESSPAPGVRLGDWSVGQRIVVEYGESHRGMVEAGPGTGKTAVACRRVAYLVEECNLEPSKILLLSFTRAAVGELRDRIASYMAVPADLAGLVVVTLDSFTWQILRGPGGKMPNSILGGYEQNVESLIAGLDRRNKDIVDFLSELEHVVIDEAQDLVAARCELSLKLIHALSEDCGVTVFADRAQSIYGWTTEDGESPEVQQTLVEEIHDSMAGRFSEASLDDIHRTSDPHLIELFTQGRRIAIAKPSATIADWEKMRDLIERIAHVRVDAVRNQPLHDRGDVLVLHRSRLGVLSDSAYLWSSGISHKVRMGGVCGIVHPWIARVLCGVQERTIKRGKFLELWEGAIGVGDAPMLCETAWDLLLDHASDRHGQLDMARLRSTLGRDRPPIDFLVSESEVPGPTIGTIHSSKGREADTVLLVLPAPPAGERDLQSLAEEMRVLFVGASRARQVLVTARQRSPYGLRLASGRACRKTGRGKIQAEVGLSGDVDVMSPVSTELFSSREAASEHQEYLWGRELKWRQGDPGSPLALIYSPDLQRNLIVEDGGLANRYRVVAGKRIALMSEEFGRDLWGLPRVLGLEGIRPPGQIRHLHMTGTRTAVVPEGFRNQLHEPFRTSGLLLVPVVTGFPSMNYKNRGGRMS